MGHGLLSSLFPHGLWVSLTEACEWFLLVALLVQVISEWEMEHAIVYGCGVWSVHDWSYGWHLLIVSSGTCRRTYTHLLQVWPADWLSSWSHTKHRRCNLRNWEDASKRVSNTSTKDNVATELTYGRWQVRIDILWWTFRRGGVLGGIWFLFGLWSHSKGALSRV
jgi:hypothetical protein